MTVSGVNAVTGVPVNTIQNSNLKNVSQPVASAQIAAPEPEVYQEQKNSSSNPAKVLLFLGAIGALTYGIVRYRNIQALKPVIQNFEKSTKDGGRLTTQIIKTKARNTQGDIVDAGTKSIKTYFDKDGIKRSEIIHNTANHERYTVYYDKDGNVTKNIVSRMSIPTKGAKSRVEQQVTNVYTRNNNNSTVTTETRMDDYSGSRRVNLYSYSKTENIPQTAPAVVQQD